MRTLTAIFILSLSSLYGEPTLNAQTIPGILRTPLPDKGAVPPITPAAERISLSAPDDARTLEWRGIIQAIKKKHFRVGRRPEQRAEGIEELRQIDDYAAFQPMIELLSQEKDDVRLAMLEHFSANDQAGQAALAWAAIYSEDKALRYEATLRIAAPACPPVLAVLDHALRDTRHAVVSNAASLANAINAIETIPLLIFNQATTDDYSDTGDLAWIAIGTQMSYVQDLVPVVGDGAGAFNPIVGTILEGTVLAIQDAIVVVYRTEVHFALRNLTTRDWGRPTDHLAWDMKQWWHWYNDEYVPYKRAQAQEQEREQHVTELLDGLHDRSAKGS